MSLGIMQIRSDVLIGNTKSVQLAEEYINAVLRNKDFPDSNAMVKEIAFQYNPGKLYVEEIQKVFNCINYDEQDFVIR